MKSTVVMSGAFLFVFSLKRFKFDHIFIWSENALALMEPVSFFAGGTKAKKIKARAGNSS